MKNGMNGVPLIKAGRQPYIHGESRPRTDIDASLAPETLIMVTNATPPPADSMGREGVSGGLLASLIPVMNERCGIWISGEPLNRKMETHPLAYPPLNTEPAAEGYRRVGAQYPERLHDSYYGRIANGLLWPVYHGLLEQIGDYSFSDWKAYQQVNRFFATTTANLCSTGSTVLIHDYQISLAPQMIRAETGTDANICFYLHIPFPSCDIFRTVPWAKEVLRGMLGANLIGFHTEAYCRNFMDCATQLLGASCDYEAGRIFYDDRAISIRAVPVSIDTQQIYQLRRQPDVRNGAQQKRRDIGAPKLLLGVDRLDYTKGIDRRIQAIDLLLERYPEWREQITFVQIAVPSRESIEKYQLTRSKIEALTGHVNGKWSTPSWDPIKLMCHSFGLAELVEWYLAADVCLVTPLRDGMNLVAKEYCAAQLQGQGVLVLSEFAGAAAELDAAILTNPMDIEGMSQHILQALTMDPEEARRRMTVMNRLLTDRTAHQWVTRLLEAMS